MPPVFQISRRTATTLEVEVKMKIYYNKLVQEQIDLIRKNAAFTEAQEKIFSLLLTDTLLDEGIAYRLGMSRAAYYRQKKILQDKVRRVLDER